MKLVLASNSQGRKAVLEEHGFDFTVDASHVDESSVKCDDVKDLVMELAKRKAEAVATRHKDSIVIGVDTLVYFNGNEIGQQGTDADAERTLKSLMGATHDVLSGLCVINTNTGDMVQDFEVSHVTLKSIAEDDLDTYLKSGKYRGKAGAYDINDPGFFRFIDHIEGSFLNIRGMPVDKIRMMITKLNKEV